MKLDELTGRRVALLGLGADVRAAIPAIVAAQPAELVVIVDDPNVDIDLPVRPYTDGVDDVEVFVRSPGFPRYRPELQAALAAGARMTTPLDLWVGTYGGDRTIVAITGTKGKSTVTALLGTLAARGRIDAGVAGNLGVPVFSDDWNHEAPLIILEVSSYQAADFHHVPDIAILTFLSEDHLSWHGGLDRYVSDKLRVIHNESGTAATVLVPEHGGRAADVLADLGVSPIVVAPPPADPTVPAHRVQNAALAAAALAELGGPQLVDVEVVALARHAMPGRLDPCPGPDGVLCLDDALASNPTATAAALAWLRTLDRPTIVLLGGTDRQVDPAPLVDEVGQWEPGMLRAITLPDNGCELAAAIDIDVAANAVDVPSAAALAISATRGDAVILFSPAAPTPSEIGNWETRSSQFRDAVADPA